MNLPVHWYKHVEAWTSQHRHTTNLSQNCVVHVYMMYFLIYYVYKCKEDKGKPNISSCSNKEGLFIKLFMRIFKENLDI